MKIPSLIVLITRSLVALVCITGLAIGFGGPGKPAPLSSINDPFKNIDYSDLPPVRRFSSRDGAPLAFREYPARPPARAGSVVLIHGSSARSNSMHVLARALARAGYATYALDMRGHGDSGAKGHIAYIGQLEDDIDDFMKTVRPMGETTLAGFSSGGGFALRFAGGERQKLFADYLLLSPFLHQNAPTYKPDSGGWVKVGVPRAVALTGLNRLGITAFNDLPIVSFALNAAAEASLTPQYSFAMAENFRPRRDYRADIRSAAQPMEVLVGQNDEAFYADRFAAVFAAEGKSVPVTIVPKVGHVPLTLDPAAVKAAVAAVERLKSRASPP